MEIKDAFGRLVSWLDMAWGDKNNLGELESTLKEIF